MNTTTQLPSTPTERPLRRMTLAPVAVVLAIVIAAAWLGANQPTPVTADPLDVTTRYFDAFERGDVDAVEAALADSEETTVRFLDSPDGSAILRMVDTGAVHWLGYLLGAGSAPVDVTCAVTGESVSATVECTSSLAHATRRAVGAPDLATSTTFEIRDGKIVGFDETVIASGPNIGDGYHAWLMDRHPEDAAIAMASTWPSVEAAVEAGRAEARHLEEYAGYLEANDCPSTGC